MNEPLDHSLSGKTAVIVAVEAIQAMHLSRVLARVGVQVLESVVTEEESLQFIESRKPDLVLYDVGTLTGDGAQVPPRVLPVSESCLILLCHLPEQECRTLVSEWGAQGYLTKPMDREQILARIQEAWTNMRHE